MAEIASDRMLAAPTAVNHRSQWNAAMRPIRRLHLYFGLLMFPLVLLYGITGFLFNHPNILADEEVRSFGPEDLSGTPLEGLPSPADAAGLVIKSLRSRDGTEGQSYRLAHPEKASYSRLFAIAKGAGQQHNIFFDPLRGTGTVRSKALGAQTEHAPFVVIPGSASDDSFADRFRRAMPAILTRLGLSAQEVIVRSVPELTFVVDADGRLWNVTYNLDRGSVAAQPVDSGPEQTSVRRFLIRLHLAHGFPDGINARWFWAIAVDAMFITMVFWALSGILMWWQIRAVRRWGFVTLVIGGIAFIALATGMSM